jgi:TonB family protein
MRLVTFLLFSSLVFGQTATPPSDPTSQPSASSSDQKNNNGDFGLGIGAPGRQMGGVDVLSDTKGVDFGPYLKGVVKQVRDNWYHLIPECAERMKGKLAIEFAITKEGKVAGMKLVASSGATTLDRPAWGSITASNPFPPLPNEFTGPFLALRVRFYYNPDSTGSKSSDKKDCPERIDLAESRSKTKSGIAVSISAPRPSDLEVPLGGSIVLTAIVTGTGTRENTVDWNLSGFGCSGATCGEITKDSYHAPTVMPNPPLVTLTAVSKADTAAKASVTLHIVQPQH